MKQTDIDTLKNSGKHIRSVLARMEKDFNRNRQELIAAEVIVEWAVRCLEKGEGKNDIR
jgi:hypothetical protein